MLLSKMHLLLLRLLLETNLLTTMKKRYSKQPQLERVRSFYCFGSVEELALISSIPRASVFLQLAKRL